MKRVCVLLFSLAAILGCESKEQTVETQYQNELKAGNEVFSFTDGYIESLRNFKINIERANELNQGNFSNEMDFWVASVKMANLYVREIEMAKSRIAQYKDSDNPLIAESAKMILLTYAMHGAVAQQRTEMIKSILTNPEEYDEGQSIVKMGNLAADSENAWEMLMNGSVLVTHCLVSDEPDEKGHLSYLIINSEERKELLDSLIDVFGENIKSGLVSRELSYFEGVGAALYEVLGGEHKSADERSKAKANQDRR